MLFKILTIRCFNFNNVKFVYTLSHIDRKCFQRLRTFGSRLFTCCDGRIVYKPNPVSYCCGNQAYDPLRHICCGNQVYRKKERYYSCCGDEVRSHLLVNYSFVNAKGFTISEQTIAIEQCVLEYKVCFKR